MAVGEPRFEPDTFPGSLTFAVPRQGCHVRKDMTNLESETLQSVATTLSHVHSLRAPPASRYDLGPLQTHLETFLSEISDGVILLDHDLRIKYLNPPAGKMLGREPDHVIGELPFGAFPEARGSVFEQEYTRAVRSQSPAAFETYFDRPPYRNWYDVRAIPLSGGLCVLFTVTTDRHDEPPLTTAPGASIMIVEDDARMRKLIELSLRRAGFTVITVDSGAEAANMFSGSRANHPAVIVSDVSLNRTSGPEVVHAVRKTGADPRVLYVSGMMDPEEIEKLCQDGSRFLQKPFSPRVLVTTVHSLLQRSDDTDTEDR